VTWDVFVPGVTDEGEHTCYFCSPAGYPPMPDEYTLCARCGNFMWTGEIDPLNERMAVCILCRQAMGIPEEES